MSTPWSWSGGGRRQVDEVGWSQKVMEMGWGTDKGGKRQERKKGRLYHDITPLLCCYIVDREKLRAMLLINPTKSTLLLILNRGEVGPKKPRQTSCIWFNRQLILLQSSPIKLSSQSLSPKPSEPNSIKNPNP